MTACIQLWLLNIRVSLISEQACDEYLLLLSQALGTEIGALPAVGGLSRRTTLLDIQALIFRAEPHQNET